MRILHTADWHLGKNLEGHSRLDEQEEFLEDIIKIVNDEKVDLVIIAGDIYDTSNPPARAEKLFYKTLKRMSENGERMILVISGNHDNPERLVAAGPLAREHGIIMVGLPKTVVETGEYGQNMVVDSGEGFVEIKINDESAVILTLPYPSEKRLNEVIYKDMDDEDKNLKSYSDRIKEFFDKGKVKYREDTINLVVSHLFAMDSEISDSERNISLGGSYIVNGSVYPSEAQYIALGHIHKPQIVPNTNKRARYSGAPIHYNKSEINYEKKCFIVDVKPNEECKVKEIALKRYKPIEIWKCGSVDEAIKMCKDNADKNCYVYLEIKTDSYIREDEIKQMKSSKADIIEITPIIEAKENEEAEEDLLKEEKFEDLFKSFYKKQRGVEPTSEVLEMLNSLIADIEE